jgi:uncharacterized membrane protein
MCLRLFHIGQQSLWFDEAFSLLLARQDISFILSNAAGDVHPAFYYLLLHFWLWLGADETTIRLLSALLNVLTMPILYVVGARLLGRAVGSVAVLLFAITPSQIQFSQEARMYALLVLLSTLSIWCFLWARDNDRWLAWLCLAGTALIGLYTHYLSVFTLVALHLFALTSIGRWRLLMRLLIIDVVIGLLFTPQLWIALTQVRIVAGDYWLETPSLAMLISTPSLLFTNAAVPFAAIPIPVVLAALVLSWVIIPLLAIQLFIAWRSGSQREKDALILLLSLALCAPILSYLISQVKPIYLIRTLLTTIPACTLLLAWLMVRLRYRLLVPLCMLAVIGVFATSLVFYYFDPCYSKEPFREVMAYIAAERAPGDIYLHTSGGSYLPFLAYSEVKQDYLLQADPDLCPPTPHHNLDPKIYIRFGGQVTDLDQILSWQHRIWLIAYPFPDLACATAVNKKLSEKHLLVQQTSIQRIQLYLYTLPNVRGR